MVTVPTISGVSNHTFNRDRRATIYDVAELAGVSHQTVSRFLRGENVREHTRERVEKALEDLDYHPNQLAKALATNKSYRIAAFVQTGAQWALLEIMDGAAEEARKAGYVLDLVTVDTDDAAVVAEAVDIMAQSSLAGAVVLAASDSMLRALDSGQVSCPVIVERSARKNPGPYPEPDFAKGVEHLIELGHRKFFLVSGPLDWPASRARRKTLAAIAEANGGEVLGEAEGDWSAASGFAALEDRFDPASGVTAIACANDHMALGVLHWLQRNGISVPDQMSVLGFDGLPDGEFYNPPLTSVAVDNRAFGRHIMQRLFRRIGVKARNVPTGGELIVRETTAAPRLGTLGDAPRAGSLGSTPTPGN